MTVRSALYCYIDLVAIVAYGVSAEPPGPAACGNLTSVLGTSIVNSNTLSLAYIESRTDYGILSKMYTNHHASCIHPLRTMSPSRFKLSEQPAVDLQSKRGVITLTPSSHQLMQVFLSIWEV